jgi:hypothetical protein
MRRCIALLAALASAVSCVLADGIPVDHKTGKVTAPHTVLDLNASQVEEMEVLGTVTLTAGQWESLRGKCRAVPKRFDTVLAITYRDCTCELNNYCIALNPRQVAVLCFDDEILSTYTLSWQLDESPICMDRRGQCYVKGVLIPFQTLLDAIAVGPPKPLEDGSESKEHYIAILPAPLESRKSSALSSRIAKVRETARQAGWDISIEDDVVGEDSDRSAGKDSTWLTDALKAN